MDNKQELRMQAVSVSFDGVRALSDVSFSVHAGEVVGLIGPNGAGKTTAVNVLSGFQKPDTGKVLLSNVDITYKTAEVRARAGVARSFQAARMFENLNVSENIEVAALGHGSSRSAARERTKEILSWISFSGKADDIARELSYGDQRWLGIARALAGAPQFLLLDEPASGLNDAECDDLNAHIVEIPKLFKCGILLIEHNMQVIMKVCERIHVLESGRSLAVGTPAEIKSNRSVREAYLGTSTAA